MFNDFHTSWDEVLESIKETLQNHILESICKMSVREAELWKTVSAFCVQDIEQQDIPAS